MASEREFDIVVYGATGFTGQLVAEYLVRRMSGDDAPRWAMAGRSQAKLAEVRSSVGAPSNTPLIVADADDGAALRAIAGRTRVVISTVGPYQLYGSPLVEACVSTGTGYVDLCGEPAWMRDMIDAHESAARASGARIVFSCGFDSIPFDCGVEQLQKHCVEASGSPARRIKGRVRTMRGTFSGGTAASMKATLAAAAKRPALLKLLADPFALTPGFSGPSQPNTLLPHFDPTVGAWVAPFVMAAINTKNVHRTNFLRNHPYGTDFLYDEMIVAGLGDVGKAAAEMIAKFNPLSSDKGPKPGEGPSREERESGFYDILFVAEADGKEAMRLAVKGDRDPGYGSTSKMISEAALCLAREAPEQGGFWTPGALLGDALVKRLVEHAGLTFEREPAPKAA
ncbi:MAG: saccharopine dehydrogenase NADP-binding domain-containing protein [Methylobacteriaceae bacterium]|nr:saccharopine dehydrogenase NADP-binding domain-containing protein [Methylobacteriaceae bacterium]